MFTYRLFLWNLILYFGLYLHCKKLWAVEELGFTAYDAALAGSSGNLTDHIAALNYNPAILDTLNQAQVSATYGFPNLGPQGGSNATDWSVHSGKHLGQKIGATGFSWHQLTEQQLYREQALTFGYGRRMFYKSSGGVALQYLRREVEPNSNLSIPNQDLFTHSIGIDLGFLWRFRPRYVITIAYQGINNPEPALSFNNSGVLRSGLAYRAQSYQLGFQANRYPSIRNSGKDLDIAFAGEKTWTANRAKNVDISLRAAIDIAPARQRQAHLGFGYRLNSIQIDYALLLPFFEDRIDRAASHQRLTLSYRFGINKYIENNKQKKDYRIDKKFYLEKIIKAIQKIELQNRETELNLKSIQQLEYTLSRQLIYTDQHKSLYSQILEQYWSKKDSDVSKKVLLEYLETSIHFFKKTSINSQTLEEEYKTTEKMWQTISENFRNRWREYQTQVSKEINAAQRVEYLIKLTDEFTPQGIDMADVKNELEEIRKLF